MGLRQPRMLAPGPPWRHVVRLDSAQTALADCGHGFTSIGSSRRSAFRLACSTRPLSVWKGLMACLARVARRKSSEARSSRRSSSSEWPSKRATLLPGVIDRLQ